MKIIISPFSRQTLNKTMNPKNYPYWKTLVNLLFSDGHSLTQIGVKGEKLLCSVIDKKVENATFQELERILYEHDTFICVDNFFHHFAWLHGKQGIVLFSQSDPRIFGHKENINLLKDRKYLRPNQFDMWHMTKYDSDAFIEPQIVYTKFKEIYG